MTPGRSEYTVRLLLVDDSSTMRRIIKNNLRNATTS